WAYGSGAKRFYPNSVAAQRRQHRGKMAESSTYQMQSSEATRRRLQKLLIAALNLLLELVQPQAQRAFFVPACRFIAHDCGDSLNLAVRRIEQRHRKCDRERASIFMQSGHTQHFSAVSSLSRHHDFPIR